jgi:hypothetical protein
MIIPLLGYRFYVLGRGDAYLLPWRDAMALKEAGECAWEESRTTRWFFEQAAPREVYRLRAFVAEARICGLVPLGWRDRDLIIAVSKAIERGDLVGVYLEVSGAKAKATDSATLQRQLVWEMEKETRGKLSHAGRTYKLTADVDLGAVPDRDRYEVVGQRDAGRILDELAQRPGTPPALAAVLAKVRAGLTRDWRPPLQPNGLILLRRVVMPRAAPVDTGPAMTPSQMRKAKLGWITIEVLDALDQPWQGDLQLILADGSTREVSTDAEGVVHLENIDPGEVDVSIEDLDAGVWNKD